MFGSGKNELLLTALREKMGECFRIIVTWARCRRARCTAWEYYSESGRIYCNCGLDELVRISWKEDEEKGTKEIKLLFISRKKKERNMADEVLSIQCMLCIGCFLWYMKMLDCSGV